MTEQPSAEAIFAAYPPADELPCDTCRHASHCILPHACGCKAYAPERRKAPRKDDK